MNKPLRYIPVAEYTIGCCHYGHREPYMTVDVKADSMHQALDMARILLRPTNTEHIAWVETRPNPDHVASMQ